MATIKTQNNRRNAANDGWDVIHQETSADLVLMGDGSTAQAHIDKLEAIKTATITTTWTGSTPPYTQTISISGVTANDKPVISPVYSATLATALLQKEAWNQISKIETGAGSITITCFEDKPITAIPIQIKGA